MLAIIAAVVLFILLLADLLNTNFGAPDLVNFNTLVAVALFLLALYLGGVGSGPVGGSSGRSWYGRRPGRG
jgi:hypothetical protein